MAAGDLTCGIDSVGVLACMGSLPGLERSLDGLTRIESGVRWTSLAPPHGRHLCGIDREGALYCWGNNANGELGTGDDAPRPEPNRVLGPGNIRWSEVATGSGSTCALTSEGHLLCWGMNAYGQLGVARIDSRWTPEVVADGSRWRNLTAGTSFACAIRNDGMLHCWGRSDAGQVGNDTTARFSPTPVCFVR